MFEQYIDLIGMNFLAYVIGLGAGITLSIVKNFLARSF